MNCLFLITGFKLLKLLSVVCGFGWQTYDCRNNIQNICSVPKAIDTVDNDVKDLEEALFNDDKIDYFQRKLDEKPKEIIEKTTIKIMMT